MSTEPNRPAFRQVAKSIRKLDGMGLVAGRPAYTADLAPQNALVVKVLRSPHAFARIRSIDVSDALLLPGVACVLTWKDVPRVNMTRAGQGYPEPSPYDKFILDEWVRYVGDEVAIVAAHDESTAREALARIRVEYEPQTPVLDMEAAEGSRTVIHPEPEARSMFEMGMDPSRNVAAAYRMSVGDVDAVLAGCDAVVRQRFRAQAQAHAMMEPHAAVTWLDVHGRLNVTSSTQTPFHVRRIIGSTFSMPLSSIRVLKPRLGGGYGGKQAIHGELLCAAVTLKTGRPAQLTYTRREVFESTYTRHPMIIDMAVGAMRDGTLRAIDMKVLSNTGAYAEHALTVLMVVGSKTLPLYNRVDAVRFDGKVVYTNMTPAGAFRGYGAIQGNFALESAIDMLARQLDIPPRTFRERNMIRQGETSPVFRIMGEGGEGVEMAVESCGLDACVQRVHQRMTEAPRTELPSWKRRGFGLAIAMQGSGIPGIDMGSAVLRLNDGGFFNLTVGATDLGTGSDTILAQMAAEGIGVDVSRIRVYSSDTDLTPFDTGAYASSTTYVSGHAVIRAAEDMRTQLLQAAAEQLGVPAASISFDGEWFDTASGRVSLDALSTGLTYSRDQRQLVSTGSFVGQKSPPPYMAGMAEVEVDVETGVVELVRYVAEVDCGTAINPNLARIQVEGALAQGIGMALHEDVRRDAEGRLLTNSFLTYGIPTRREIRELDVHFVETHEPTGPYGAKSVGEIGIDTPPAAIMNAICDAVGIRLTDLPATPEKVLAALRRKQEG